MEGISCSTWGYRKWNLDDAVASMAKIGYKGVERTLDSFLMPTSYSKTFLSKIGLNFWLRLKRNPLSESCLEKGTLKRFCSSIRREI